MYTAEHNYEDRRQIKFNFSEDKPDLLEGNVCWCDIYLRFILTTTVLSFPSKSEL